MPTTDQYLADLASNLAGGDATEHTHRPALQNWLQSFGSGITATNEPKQSENNAPDFDVKAKRRHGTLTLGKIEAKDVGISPGLKDIEADSEREIPRTKNGKQLRRYRKAFPNLLLTDYVEFRWYRKGALKLTASLGRVDGDHVVLTPTSRSEVEALVKGFLAEPPERISTAPALARRMAAIAAVIHDVIQHSFASATASDTTTGLLTAFRDTLVPDLTEDQFADMLAQTIAYGLFAARVQHDGQTAFTREKAAAFIPKTNPFLRGLFAHVSGPTLSDEPYAGTVDDLAQLLHDADIDKVLANFGADKRDPIVHFYETFLSVYNPTLRDIRGVYYTPLPVVEFILDSVDHVLRSTFALPGGVADTNQTDDGQHRVVLLDPATGTGTFLYAAVGRIRQQFIDQGRGALWSAYVSEHLLPRLFGFELMVAPYAVAHLKLALQLAGMDMPADDREDIAYDFEKDERVGVYLTNALDPGEAHSTLPLGKFISDEANAASSVKTDKPIMVVMGNPPYQGQSANASTRREVARKVKGKTQYRTVRTAIGELIETYKSIRGVPLGEGNPKWLQDDYVKFIRLGQSRIEQTGNGVLAYVTNHTYLDAPTFRGMRHSLLETFDEIYVLDLHGSARRREKNPDGGVDENVFDQIMQGVVVAVFVKSTDSTEPATVHYADLWGSRSAKYEWLDSNHVGTVTWQDFVPAAPFFSFRPQDASIREEWEACVSLTDVFPTYATGIVTHRDEFATDTRRERVLARLREFCDPTKTDAQVRARFFGTKSRTTPAGITYPAGDNRDWNMKTKRASLMADGKREDSIKPYAHRPFDTRWVMYHKDAIDALKFDVMRHMLAGGNLGFISARSNKSPTQDQFFVTDQMSEVKLGEATTGSVLFPLWLHPDEGKPASAQGQDQLFDAQGQQAVVGNIGEKIKDRILSALGLAYVDEDRGDLKATVGARDIFDYAYAVVHSPSYRLRYADFLRSDYPRIPIVTDLDAFRELVRFGQTLVELHTLNGQPNVAGSTPTLTKGTNKIDAIPVSQRWEATGDGHGRLRLNTDGGKKGGAQTIDDVPERVWTHHVGGHRVLQKWMEARAGDTLSHSELTHLLDVLNAIAATHEVVDQIDERFADWPIA